MRAQLRNENSQGFVLGNQCKLDMSSWKHSSCLFTPTGTLLSEHKKLCLHQLRIKNPSAVVVEVTNYDKYVLNECAPAY